MGSDHTGAVARLPFQLRRVGGAGRLSLTGETVLGWIIRFAPLAVFAVVAQSVGKYGMQPLRGLAWYVGVGLLGLLLHAVVTYQLWLVLFVRLPLLRFWRESRE